MALYWPEDSSLKNTPVMDHENGYFTDKLILGKRGSQIKLRNSDEVGHTIYVKDTVNNIRWQLNYMPPGSEFEQTLDWPEDIFVEMRCRLHLYMSAWVGSISSRYHKIIQLSSNTEQNEEQSYWQESMQGYPEEFNQLKIWLPKYQTIHTRIDIGESQTFDLVKGSNIMGKIHLRRFTQKTNEPNKP